MNIEPAQDLESVPSVGPGERCTPVGWAYRQVELRRDLERAAVEFVERYTEPDGTLPWRTTWPGIDGSDDPYEAFQGLPMLYLLGGSDELLAIARRQWEAVTWQWTEYGQIHREYDSGYDWMHHGEADNLFRLLGFCDPSGFRERQRAVRFAGFYTGDDPSAPNYDPERRLIRSPLTGSRGPRFAVTAEDWQTHREVLDGYPPPFEDLDGVPGPSCPWTDDRVYAQILERMNARMTRGDVPLNLTSTGLVTHAFLHTGFERFRAWVGAYVDAWRERAVRNGGIVPDNVGLDDIIGQYVGGAWWGGYYGWRWPHGASQLLEAVTIGSANAALLARDPGAGGPLDFVRGQLDAQWALGHPGRDGSGWVVPFRHVDAGWIDYRAPDPRLPIACWFQSYDEGDLQRVLRIPGARDWGTPVARAVKGNGAANSPHWFAFASGHGRADYPELVLEADRELMGVRLAELRGDDGDPADWDIHHWQDKSPVFTEGLVQTMLGAPLHLYHGGLQFATVRYFDARRRRTGLPKAVAALVSRLDADGATLELVDTRTPSSEGEEHEIVVQAGGFGEHTIVRATPLVPDGRTASGAPIEVGGPRLRVRLRAGRSVRLRLILRRFTRTPSYDTPWLRCADLPPLLGTDASGRGVGPASR